MSVQSHDLHLLTGVYAVDALTGDELDEFEKHLEQCPTCAEEVRGLRETAARLGLATAIDAAAVDARAGARRHRTGSGSFRRPASA